MRILAAPLAAIVLLAGVSRAGPVKLGIDVLAEQRFAPLVGKRAAVITNQTGVASNGTRLIQLLLDDQIKLVKLFSPEHGLYGVRDEKVSDSVDEKTGLPVLSLYGKTRKPTKEMLAGVDVIVFDVQDVGTRFYTYISTMGLAMEAAAENHVEIVVLDRPNPIGGLRVEGPLADAKHLGFTAYRPIPLVHGMTVGELAELFNAEYKINAKLTVVPMEGWRREMYWDDTGVKWINPSPNLRSPAEALLYPAVGLLESSNVSVGRGTETPFELFGAPFIDGQKLCDALAPLDLKGVAFEPVTFTPDNAIHKLDKTECHGIRIKVTDRDAFDSTLTGMCFAWTLHRLYPGEKWTSDEFVKMAQNQKDVTMLWTLDDPRKANEIWHDDLATFKAVRAKYLKY